MTEKDLEHAIHLLKIGRRVDARKLVETFLKDHRDHMYAWWLYAETWPDGEDRKRIWGYCLKFNPGSNEAKKALAALETVQISGGMDITQKPKKEKISLPFKLFSGCSGIIILFLIGAIFNDFMSRPIDPAPYYHSSPVKYYLYAPKNYTHDQKWPLFVGIHGSGGSGLDCWNLWQTYADKEGFILLCPSIPGDGGGFYQDVGEITVNNAVKDVQKNYQVNSQMFFAGFSAGAYFVQGYAYHYPDSVSGLAVLSSGYYVTGISPKIPMVLITGNIEPQSSLDANQKLFEYMKKNGGDVEYHILQWVGHQVTNKTKKMTIELFRKTEGK